MYQKGNSEMESIKELKEEIEEYEVLAELTHKRLLEADEYWQKITGKSNVFPDLGSLLKFLMDKVIELENANKAPLSSFEGGPIVLDKFSCLKPTATYKIFDMLKEKQRGQEVHKFEDVFEGVTVELEELIIEGGNSFALGFYVDKWRKLSSINEFITQDFTPDMIEKYFEGWDIKANWTFYSKDYDILVVIDDVQLSIEVGTLDFVFPKPLTLSDFITFCKSAGIELRWKDE